MSGKATGLLAPSKGGGICEHRAASTADIIPKRKPQMSIMSPYEVEAYRMRNLRNRTNLRGEVGAADEIGIHVDPYQHSY